MCMNRCGNKEQTGDDEEDEKASIEEIIQNTQQIILLWNKIFKKLKKNFTSLQDEHLRVSFSGARTSGALSVEEQRWWR